MPWIQRIFWWFPKEWTLSKCLCKFLAPYWWEMVPQIVGGKYQSRGLQKARRLIPLSKICIWKIHKLLRLLLNFTWSSKDCSIYALRKWFVWVYDLESLYLVLNILNHFSFTYLKNCSCIIIFYMNYAYSIFLSIPCQNICNYVIRSKYDIKCNQMVLFGK